MWRMCSRWCALALFVVALGAPAMLGANKPVTLDTDPNLVGWWKFEETTGNVAADSSGHKHDAVLQGDLTFDRVSAPGKAGKAAQFGGKDSFAEVKDYKGITGTHCRTVAAWIKTKSSRGDVLAWGKEDFGQMFTFGFVRGRTGVTPRGGYLYMKVETNDDQWHHVAAVVEEAELPNLYNDVKLYLDGEPAVIHDIGLLDLWPIQTGKDLNVRLGRGFQGLLDDVRLYDRPLTPDEIKALFKLDTNRPLNQTKGSSK